MSEPKRWIDDEQVSGHIRELLHAGGAPPPMPAAASSDLLAVAQALVAKGAVSKAVGAGVASTASGAGVATKAVAAPTLGVKLLGLKALGTMLVAGSVTSAGVIGYGVFADQTRQGELQTEPSALQSRSQSTAAGGERAPSRTVFESLAARQSSRSELGHSTQGAASEATLTPKAQPGTTSSRPDSAKPRELPPDAVGSSSVATAPLPSASFASETLAHEAELLLRAREELSTNPQRALGLATEHRRLHPNGQLGADRELIVVDALIRLGRRDEARKRATPLISAAPTGIYARRLRQLLGDPEQQ